MAFGRAKIYPSQPKNGWNNNNGFLDIPLISKK
jgi:hypothetical protein